MIFKYSELKQFIAHMKECGKVIPLRDYDSSNAIILRHDVDFDVEAAYKLALVEKECDVLSTFFFLTTAHSYNPFSESNRIKISKMSEMGFEIGLHFDPTVYGDVSDDKLTEFAKQEAKLLSFITGVDVKSVSLHNPSVHGRYPMLEGFNNAYDKEIFYDEIYLSDSRMDFRGKNPYKFVENGKNKTLQVLLHPLHYSENGLGYPEFMYNYTKNHTDAIDLASQVNSGYVEQMEGEELFSYIVNKATKA